MHGCCGNTRSGVLAQPFSMRPECCGCPLSLHVFAVSISCGAVRTEWEMWLWPPLCLRGSCPGRAMLGVVVPFSEVEECSGNLTHA